VIYYNRACVGEGSVQVNRAFVHPMNENMAAIQASELYHSQLASSSAVHPEPRLLSPLGEREAQKCLAGIGDS
jgi:hypothetical protein